MRRDAIALLLPALVMAVSGCATKNWVRDALGKKSAEFDDRVGRVEGQVGQVSESARGARQRADEVDGRLTRLWGKRHARDVVETFDVYFGFDRSDLTDSAQTTLATLAKELRENPKLSVDLQGYTDPVGPREYNVRLSQRRVESVRRYLVERGVELPRVYTIGLGPLDDRSVTDEQKRRVTVKLMLYAE